MQRHESVGSMAASLQMQHEETSRTSWILEGSKQEGQATLSRPHSADALAALLLQQQPEAGTGASAVSENAFLDHYHLAAEQQLPRQAKKAPHSSSMTLLGLLSPTVYNGERELQPLSQDLSPSRMKKQKMKGRFPRSKRALASSPTGRRSPASSQGSRLSPTARSSPGPFDRDVKTASPVAQRSPSPVYNYSSQNPQRILHPALPQRPNTHASSSERQLFSPSSASTVSQQPQPDGAGVFVVNPPPEHIMNSSNVRFFSNTGPPPGGGISPTGGNGGGGLATSYSLLPEQKASSPTSASGTHQQPVQLLSSNALENQQTQVFIDERWVVPPASASVEETASSEHTAHSLMVPPSTKMSSGSTSSGMNKQGVVQLAGASTKGDILRVIGHRCTIFDRPKRSEIRKYAVWKMYSSQASFLQGSGAHSSSQALLWALHRGGQDEFAHFLEDENIEGLDALDERLLELMYRDITPEDYDTLLELDEANAKKTAERSALDRLPCVTDFSGYSEEQLTCGVCYMRVDEDQEEVERIFQMPCRGRHIFHEACVTKWLLEVKAACPTCHEPICEEAPP
ncbi:unnamed protein product [Amoebophrya sp. A120]|nr:unnamed protein product [Amoebophrya sp. A120]|eukprot:GSA120T00002876001.1